MGGQRRCLYVDRGFYGVEVLRSLQEEADVPCCVAAPLKGEKEGLAALGRREGAGLHAYTVRSRKHGSIRVPGGVVGRYWKGR